jgi:methylated-DNA-[protein]-cysteine S-methyltransferase
MLRYKSIEMAGTVLHAVAGESGVVRLGFGPCVPDPGWLADDGDALIREAVRQLEAYFRGELRQFDLPLDLAGTPFQRRVWEALLRIPYGETRSYAGIATEVGTPTGFRAVGGANHANPVAIVVPCHRVINADGGLGGYGGGLGFKRMLLELERSVVAAEGA